MTTLWKKLVVSAALLQGMFMLPCWHRVLQASAALPAGLYHNPDGSPLITLMSSASSSIDIEIYEMEDPQVRLTLRQALAKKVRVRIIHEPKPVGLSCDIFSFDTSVDTPDCRDQKALANEIRQSSGGQYVPYNKSALCGTLGKSCFEHGKLALIDRKTALVSTGNYNSSSLCDLSAKPTVCNRDYTYLLNDGQSVGTLESIFEADLRGQAYNLAAMLPGALAQRLTVSPLSLQPLVHFIESARSTIQLQNQYLKDPTLNSALMAAAQRGVKVSVNVASACSFSRPTPSATQSWTAIFQAFDRAGVHSRIFDHAIQIHGLPGYLHAKAILVDGVRGWVGSVNGSTESLTENREFGVFFSDSNSIKNLSNQMTQDMTNPGGESWQDSLRCLKDRPGVQPVPALESL